jgi:hypothetical protein
VQAAVQNKINVIGDVSLTTQNIASTQNAALNPPGDRCNRGEIVDSEGLGYKVCYTAVGFVRQRVFSYLMHWAIFRTEVIFLIKWTHLEILLLMHCATQSASMRRAIFAAHIKIIAQNIIQNSS